MSTTFWSNATTMLLPWLGFGAGAVAIGVWSSGFQGTNWIDGFPFFIALLSIALVLGIRTLVGTRHPHRHLIAAGWFALALAPVLLAPISSFLTVSPYTLWFIGVGFLCWIFIRLMIRSLPINRRISRVPQPASAPTTPSLKVGGGGIRQCMSLLVFVLIVWLYAMLVPRGGLYLTGTTAFPMDWDPQWWIGALVFNWLFTALVALGVVVGAVKLLHSWPHPMRGAIAIVWIAASIAPILIFAFASTPFVRAEPPSRPPTLSDFSVGPCVDCITTSGQAGFPLPYLWWSLGGFSGGRVEPMLFGWTTDYIAWSAACWLILYGMLAFMRFVWRAQTHGMRPPATIKPSA